MIDLVAILRCGPQCNVITFFDIYTPLLTAGDGIVADIEIGTVLYVDAVAFAIADGVVFYGDVFGAGEDVDAITGVVDNVVLNNISGTGDLFRWN